MRKLTLTQKILLCIEENKLLIAKSIYRPSKFVYNYLYTREQISKQAYYNTVGRLKREGYLEEVENEGRRRLRATIKGKIKILKFLKRDKQWDGKWRIVIFDIPEIKKKMRNFFREKLSELGFRKLQESVWICPYNISTELEELIDLCWARPFIHYLLVEEIDNKSVLMDLFKLQGENTN